MPDAGLRIWKMDVRPFNRKVLAIEVDFNLPAARVVRTLERIVVARGYPLKLRLDNGPELFSVTLADWAEQHGVTLEFIKPGKPTQNDFIERFNRSYRENIWVVNNGDSTVMKVSPSSPSSGTVVTTYASGKGPFSVAFDGSRIWLPNFGSNSVSTTAAN